MNKDAALALLKKNTYYKYPLIDDSEVEMTLAFYLLKKLEGTNPGLAERYYKLTSNKLNKELEIVTILYTAYCCANMDDPDMMDEDTFCIMIGDDRMAMQEAVQKLIGSKKKAASGTHS